MTYDGTVQINNKRSQSLFRQSLRRLLKNKVAVISMISVIVIILLSAFAPYLSPWKLDDIDWDNMLSPPNFANGHYFGTDALGRDLFVRTFYGTRISLLVGLAATVVSISIGLLYGAIAGYTGGRVDSIMMRIVDVLYALPFMFLLILLVTFFGRNIILIFVAIGAISWLTMARVVRGQAINLRHKEFVQAAEALGVKKSGILRCHIVPNMLGIIIIYATLTIPGIILEESFLSFLGLGVQEPLTSLGTLIAEGVTQMEQAQYVLLFPAAFLVILLLSFNFIGDGLRDAFDPKDR